MGWSMLTHRCLVSAFKVSYSNPIKSKETNQLLTYQPMEEIPHQLVLVDAVSRANHSKYHEWQRSIVSKTVTSAGIHTHPQYASGSIRVFHKPWIFQPSFRGWFPLTFGHPNVVQPTKSFLASHRTGSWTAGRIRSCCSCYGSSRGCYHHCCCSLGVRFRSLEKHRPVDLRAGWGNVCGAMW